MSSQPLAVDTKPIEAKLVTLKDRAEAIVVDSPESYTLACQIVLEGRKEVKAIGFALDPGIESAKNHLDELRSQKAGWVNRVTPIINMAEQKAEKWKADERRKAKAEEDRINEERRQSAAKQAEEERKERERQAEIDRKNKEAEIKKAQKAGDIGKREADRLAKEAKEKEQRDKELAAKQAEEAKTNVQTVTVAPSTPTVAGIKARVNWKFRVVRSLIIPREFLMPDEVEIGAMVRRTKDKAKAEAACPGIEVYSEDSI